MKRDARKRGRKIAIFCLVLLIVAGTTGLALINPAITRYVESDAFRAELERQTAKGLHFPAGHFAPIHRMGFLSAVSDRFQGEKGRKAMTKLDAHDLRASFNPFGVLLRRWQVDELHIGGGEVAIQTYVPKPEPSPSKPWFHIFLPNRVYLQRVWSDPVNVTWRLRDEPAGFFGTRLVITPHGRDFEYRATGGTMKMALVPDLNLRQTHLLITKTELSLYEFELGSGDGVIRAEGRAGTRDDRSIDFKLSFDKLPLREWVPEGWRGYVAGTAHGQAHWRGADPKLESASVQSSFRVEGGRLRGFKFLEEVASIAKRESFSNLELNECAAELDWEKDAGELRKIAVEAKGKVRIEGNVRVEHRSLGGALNLGVAPDYLEWLPHAEEVFTKAEGGYLWTTVHLSGTLDSPQQDLSPRVLAALKETPGAFLGAALRALGVWLPNKGEP